MPNYTREPAKEVQLPPRLPLLGVQNQRAGSPEIDSRLVNGYVEFGADEVLRIIKRPGLAVKYELPERTGLGTWERLSLFYRTSANPNPDTYLYSDSTLLYSWRGESSDLYSSEIVSKPFNFSDTTRFFHNASYVFTYDAVDGKIDIPLSGTSFGPVSGTLTIGDPTVLISTAGISRFAGVTGTGIPADTFVESIDSAGQLTLSANATAAGAQNLTFSQAGPGENSLVRGAGDLDSATYLFNSRRQVWGSEPGNPWQWNPLNFLYAYSSQATPRALYKQLTYLVAFKSEDTEFFRNAGASPGSPLARVDSLQLQVGVSNGDTVVALDDSIFWVSNTISGLRSVWQLRNGKAQEIAWPSVKRLISQNASGFDPTYAIAFSCAGHLFYILTSPTGGYSLVYDQTSSYWSYWEALGETYFPFVSATLVGSELRLQHESNGKIYTLSPDTLTDEGETFDMDIYPPEYDANSRLGKYLSKMYIVADQTAGSELLVRVNDDNQTAGEWSNFRAIDLSEARPRLDECGSFYKRSFHFRHSSATRCRLQAVELDLQLGTL